MWTFGLDIPHGENNRTPGVYDPGAIGGGQQEHNKGEGMVKRLLRDLTALGYRVSLSSGALNGRWLVHSRAKAAVVISPHMNAGRGRGGECWVSPVASRQTVLVATLIAKNLARATGLPNRGVKRKAFAIFRYPRTVIVEMAFIDSADLVIFNQHLDGAELAILNGMLVGVGLPAQARLPRK